MSYQSKIEQMNMLLSTLSAQVKGAGAMGLNDLARLSENIMQPVLQKVFGLSMLRLLDLENQKDFPAIDLGDVDAGIAFQITASRRREKIIHTLNKFFSYDLHKRYNRLIIYILTERQRKYEPRGLLDIVPAGFKFSIKNDIMDYRDLMRLIRKLRFKELDQLIKDLEPQISDPLGSTRHWCVPHQENKYFVGRDEVIERLYTQLCISAGMGRAAAISGLGGSGKTQTALKYAQLYRSEYSAVLWVYAEHASAIEASYIKIADTLQLEYDSEKPSTAVSIVKKWLCGNDGWLLIFDNVEDQSLLDPFLPSIWKGQLLITSRAATLDLLGVPDPLELADLSAQDSVKFFKRRTGIIDSRFDQDFENLAECLVHFPLALEQAGAYIAKTKCRVKDYLCTYKKLKLELLEKSPPVLGNYNRSVATTWLVSIKEVTLTSVASAELFKVSAFLFPDAIPNELVIGAQKQLGSDIAEALSVSNSNPLAANEILMPLVQHSLVKLNADQSYNMHRLVQQVVRMSLSKTDAEDMALRAARAVFCFGQGSYTKQYLSYIYDLDIPLRIKFKIYRILSISQDRYQWWPNHWQYTSEIPRFGYKDTYNVLPSIIYKEVFRSPQKSLDQLKTWAADYTRLTGRGVDRSCIRHVGMGMIYHMASKMPEEILEYLSSNSITTKAFLSSSLTDNLQECGYIIRTNEPRKPTSHLEMQYVCTSLFCLVSEANPGKAIEILKKWAQVGMQPELSILSAYVLLGGYSMLREPMQNISDEQRLQVLGILAKIRSNSGRDSIVRHRAIATTMALGKYDDNVFEECLQLFLDRRDDISPSILVRGLTTHFLQTLTAFEERLEQSQGREASNLLDAIGLYKFTIDSEDNELRMVRFIKELWKIRCKAENDDSFWPYYTDCSYANAIGNLLSVIRPDSQASKDLFALAVKTFPQLQKLAREYLSNRAAQFALEHETFDLIETALKLEQDEWNIRCMVSSLLWYESNPSTTKKYISMLLKKMSQEEMESHFFDIVQFNTTEQQKVLSFFEAGGITPIHAVHQFVRSSAS